MTRRSSLLLVVALCLASPAAARADAPGVNKDLAANAALYYWQAIEAMPKLDVESEKLVEAWKQGPPTPAIQKLLDQHEPCLLQLHRGATFPRCEWGLDYDQGISMLLQSTQEMAALAKRAGWRARAHFEAGRHQAAVDDIVAALTAARHVGSDPILISTQVQYAMENRVIEEAAPYLTKMDPAALKSLAARLETMPPGNSLKTALRAEKELYLGWILKRLRAVDPSKSDEFQSLLLACFDREDFKTRLGEVAGSPPSREKVFALLQATQPVYDEGAELTALPAKEWPAKWTTFEQRIRAESATNPFYEKWMLNLPKVRGREARNKALWAMFKAAIAVIQGGPEKLKDHADPYGDGPLEYRRLETGFELKSKLESGDELSPVLTVGQHKK